MQRGIWIWILLAISVGARAQDVDLLISVGDAAYERRADGQVEGRAAASPIDQAVKAFEEATALAPDRVDLQWRLLRALYYEADFASRDSDQERDRYRVGAELAETYFAKLNTRLDRTATEIRPSELVEAVEGAGLKREDIARISFWTAVHWGGWAREAGLLGAVLEGVAEKMRAYTEMAVALDAGLERGGPLRLLSRMHGTLPQVPLLTGWVDRERALPLVDRAIKVLSTDVGNRYLLALTLLEQAPERRAEAQRLLEEVASSSPRDDLVIEDLLVIEAAKKDQAEAR